MSKLFCGFALIEKLSNLDEYVRATAASALVKLGDKRAVEPLIEKLRNETPLKPFAAAYADGRRNAAIILGILGDKRAVEPLIERLSDTDEYVRRAAAEALVKLGDKRAIELLIQHLNNDAHGGVREALNKFGERAVEPLIGRLSDADEGVRGAAVCALGILGDKRAVEPLIRSLNDDVSVYIRCRAADALGKLGDKRALEPLIGRLSDDKHVREAAVEALVKLGECAVEPLIKRLSDADKNVRWVATYTLGNLGDKRAVEPLIHCLNNDANKDVREKAAEALGKLGVDPETVRVRKGLIGRLKRFLKR